MKTEIQRSPIWWIPLLRRVIGWGAATMLAWGFVVSMSLLLPLAAMSSWSQTAVPSLTLRVLSIRQSSLKEQ